MNANVATTKIPLKAKVLEMARANDEISVDLLEKTKLELFFPFLGISFSSVAVLRNK